jgi:glycosyltransferase involved in cell wall biosynthesis
VPDSLRSLYICYLSLEDPLVHTQVVAYLEGLAAAGHTIHLLTYEPALTSEHRGALESDLSARGITWHSLRYHKRPSLPATVYDALAGAIVAARLVRRHRLDAVHARNHVPAATALIVRRLTGCKLIFDMRGLMAEEYADAGRWRDDGVPFRLTKRVEAAAIRAAEGMVVLTQAVRRHLFADRPEPPHLEVIPCCADIDALGAASRDGASARAELDAGERPILLYVGKFTGWYMEREMVDFYVAARDQIAGLLLVILTQADRGPALEALEHAGIDAADYRITSVPSDEVGRFTAAADAGICFIRPCLSKISSSPTKIGEYLAGGLPVVSGHGIGDVDALLDDRGVGVLVHEFAQSAYSDAAEALGGLIRDGATAERCREVAARELSLRDVGVPRYDRLYRAVAQRDARA